MGNKKNKKYTSARHAFFFALLRPLGRVYCKARYGFSAKMTKLEKGKSHFVICNHTTFADQFMVGSFFNRPLYFIASDDLTNKPAGKLLIWLLGIIPKAKSSKDLSTIRKAKRVVNEGGNVMVFPEGNRTYGGELCYVDIAIAKFAKVLKSDLIIYNLVGGYGVLPRFANKQRKGKMQGIVKEVISASEVESMPAEELYERILQGLKVEEKNPCYKSKIMAQYVERAVYVCPNCGKLDSITSKGEIIGCKHCNLKIKYKQDLTLETLQGKCEFKTISQWYNHQRNVAIETFSNFENKTVLEDENLNVFQVENDKLSVVGKFDVRFSKENGFETFKNGERSLHVPLEDILNMALMGRSKLIIYTKNTIYQLKENLVPTSMMKYMNMFYITKQRIEGVEGNDLFLGL